uniref:Arginine decarboxylase-like n=1 Tax=Rhizophora mucronata TaxID=61149 RepID=A0A2P2NHW8_RHIMU
MFASSPSLDLNLELGFAKKWILRPLRSTRTATRMSISEESVTLEPVKEQDRIGRTGKTRSVTKNDLLVSKSQTSQKDRLPPPLVTALKTSAERNVASFHFPGHNRGHAAPSSLTQLIGLRPFLHDLPELPELDNLFSPEGPILEAQIQAAQLFGSSETWFLVGGTTCGIQAAIMATCLPGEHLVLPRNCHVSAISAIVLSGATPKYIIPEYDCSWDIAGGVNVMQVQKAIKDLEMEGQRPAAVFITCPTYHGICSNLSEICQLCHSLGIPVIVDEAHGAHLGFHPEMPHSALKQGADIVVQSTHKVLCSLTQSSMLHMSGNIVDREQIGRCLQTLQTTSPSYLLLASLDAARAQLGENPETTFNKAMELASEARFLIKEIMGITVLDSPNFAKFPAIDPLRLTIGFSQLGLSGHESDDILDRDHGIISELVGTKSITYAINLGTCRDHIQRLVMGLKELSSWSQRNHAMGMGLDNRRFAPFVDATMILNPRDAFFARKNRVGILESLGKICGELICPYPPGIPVMIPGEIITQSALDYLLDVKSMGAIISGASDPLLSSMVICDV